MRSTFFARSVFACACAVGLAAGGAAVAAATSTSALMPDGSLRYDYGRRPSPLLVCKPRYVCDIMLDSGESVLNMAIGDPSHWVIAGAQSGPGGATPHVFVKPTETGLATNLVITTTKRMYDVTLRSQADASSGRIRFAYPDQDAAAKAAIADHERAAIATILAGTPQANGDAVDSKYKTSGEASLTPTKIFNDGSRTFIEWKALPSPLPAVMAIGQDGVAQPINFRVVGTSYIIDGVEPNLDLVVAASTAKHGHPERRAAIRHL